MARRVPIENGRVFAKPLGKPLAVHRIERRTKTGRRKRLKSQTGKKDAMTMTDLKAASKEAAKVAAAARAALAKAEKNQFREFADRISKLPPATDLAAAEVDDLIEWAKGLLG
jgi:hypothetical protein